MFLINLIEKKYLEVYCFESRNHKYDNEYEHNKLDKKSKKEYVENISPLYEIFINNYVDCINLENNLNIKVLSSRKLAVSLYILVLNKSYGFNLKNIDYNSDSSGNYTVKLGTLAPFKV